MDLNLLTDALVRQTMVLAAQLATSRGKRNPLAHVANQAFFDLVIELQSAGLGRKVIADMFGMSLRAYHAKIRRLSESRSQRGKTLWAAVADYLAQNGTCSREKILHRFKHDNTEFIISILSDLVHSGLAFKSGDGTQTLYRISEAVG